MARMSRFSRLLVDVFENEYLQLIKTNIELGEDDISILKKHIHIEIKKRVQRNPAHQKLVNRYNRQKLKLTDDIIDNVIKLGLYKSDMNEILFMGDATRQKEELTRIIYEHKHGTSANVIKELSRENTEIKAINKTQKSQIQVLETELEQRASEPLIEDEVKDEKTIEHYCNKYIEENEIKLLNENINQLSKDVANYAKKEGKNFMSSSIRTKLQEMKNSS